MTHYKVTSDDTILPCREDANDKYHVDVDGDAHHVQPAGRCAEIFPVSPFEILDRQLVRRSGSRAERAGGGSGKPFSAGLNGPEGHQRPISCGWQVSEISKSIIPSGL